MDFKKSGLLFCLLVSLFFLRVPVAAQNNTDRFSNVALENARAVYHQAFGDEIGLYNGKRYIEYLYPFNEGDPYFNKPEPMSGSVFYDGVRYDSVLMRYNEISDELIINYYNEKIQLLKPRIEWFSVSGGYFINLEKDSVNSELYRSGFYNVLYNGSTMLLKKEVKSMQQRLSFNPEIPDYILQHDHYYLLMNGTFRPIKRKKDLLILLEDKKKEVQQFIRQNKLNFKRDRQNMLTQTIAYYDSLKK